LPFWRQKLKDQKLSSWRRHISKRRCRRGGDDSPLVVEILIGGGAPLFKGWSWVEKMKAKEEIINIFWSIPWVEPREMKWNNANEWRRRSKNRTPLFFVTASDAMWRASSSPCRGISYNPFTHVRKLSHLENARHGRDTPSARAFISTWLRENDDGWSA
jgi:hypothetical protein